MPSILLDEGVDATQGEFHDSHENREGKGSTRAGATLVVVATIVAAGAPAQSLWSAPFNHETINYAPPGTSVPNPHATDHLLPLGGWSNPSIAYYSFGGATFDWPARMNAVHMALIPKGPHQGKVLVWGATNAFYIGAPVLVRAPGSGPSIGANQFHACAPWSIIDPAPVPAGPRFRNFLLPLEVWTAPTPPANPNTTPSLFCTGQAWSPYGDLIVAGGTNYSLPITGARLTFAFNPKILTRGWGSSPATPLYPGELGLWERGPDLEWGRFYPTMTLTARLNRLQVGPQPPRETMLVLGGSIDDLSTSPIVNHTWNEYEALVMNSAAQLGLPGFTIDQIGTARTFAGPGNLTVAEDWLEDYPRCHLLSTGKIMFSGYAPRWAQLDHDVSPGVWTQQAVAPWSSTNWQHPRHDDSSLLFPNVGGLTDMVVRMGGSDEVNYGPSTFGTTASMEAFVTPGTGAPFWANAGNLPNPQPGVLPDGRYLMNVVILPDASLLVLGGVARAPSGPNIPVTEPLLYQNGAWSVLPANPVNPQSVRDYHSTAVLLPDGRVMLGGGNSRNYDYEFFSPSYLSVPRPTGVAITSAVTYDTATDAYRLDYATKFGIACSDLPLGVTLQKAVLIAPGATTHHSDMSQRYVELTIDNQPKPHILECKTPPDDQHAPRGIYMLFLITSGGGVSNAIWVVLR